MTAAASLAMEPIRSGEAAVSTLSLSAAELSDTLDATGICIWSLDLATTQVACSAACDSLFGLPREQLTDLAAFQALLHPDDRQPRADAIEEVRRHGGAYEVDYRIIRPDGQIRWLRSRGRVQVDEQGCPVRHRGVIFSIHAQKQAEADLRAREAHLRSILDTVPEGMIVLDVEGTIRAFSTAAERIFQCSAAEVIGQNITLLMPEPDRDRHDAHLTGGRETGLLRGIGTTWITTGRRCDGTIFPVELSLGEMRSGEQVFLTGFVNDLTEQQKTQARLQELQSELVHVSRLSTVGEMVAALSHELNQPLSAVTNYTKGCRRLLDQADLAVLPKVREVLDKAADQALRAGQIIRRLREFIGRGETEKRIEPVAQIIEEAAALALIGAHEQGVETRVWVEPGAGNVLADRVQIQQILTNLIRNAREAMQDSPRRQVSITASRAAERVEIAVADTGSGISEAVAGRLFQPFVTTKATGMGVGLSICRTIAEAHGGKLMAERNGDGGATFRLRLPAADEERLTDDA